MNDIFKFLYHKYTTNPKRWYPFLAVYYLTYGCNFRCPYCSDGSGKPYYELPNNTVEPVKVLEIFRNIRKHCTTLVITGGEPLNYSGFGKVITNVKALKFKDVVLTTNGHRLDEYLDNVVDNISNLVISLDTLNAEKADRNFGIGSGTFKKIIANIEKAAKHPKRKFKIEISSVVTPENIHDLYDVYKFSQNRGFTFAAAPHLEGVKANKGLINNDEYYRFYNFLSKEKKNGKKVFGSVLYHRYMRDLKKFDCNPFTMLVVSPEGEVFYPCLEIGNYAGNILEENNLHFLRAMGEKKFGAQPKCDNRCHSACALGFSLLLKHPLTLFQYLK
jgi:MoaA/NifB/PqqE/SkfB family radical SAM enzyme